MKNHVVYGAGHGYTRADFEEIVLIQYDEILRPAYSIQFKNLKFECDETIYAFYTAHLCNITDCITYKGKFYSFFDLPNLSMILEQEKLDEALNLLE
jgi:hypothetical protein